MQLLRLWDIHIDAVSFVFVLFNVSITGVSGLFFMPAPLMLKQGYLILIGVVVAYLFTFIPEWTSWVLLAVMAIYDIFAVLVPGGPLRMLVETAQERQQVRCGGRGRREGAPPPGQHTCRQT